MEAVVETNSTGGAFGPKSLYRPCWDRWVWYTYCQGLWTPLLIGKTPAEGIRDEDLVLLWVGYLKLLNKDGGTIRTAAFALQSAHKHIGVGDPLAKMERLWILLNKGGYCDDSRCLRVKVTVMVQCRTELRFRLR